MVSKKELDLLCKWLDPKDYQPPAETATILGFSLVLAILLLTSRSPVLFGASYVAYAIAHIVGWWHLRRELRVAIRGSRERLKDESRDKAAIYAKALDLLEAYYITCHHMLRSASILIFSAAGLAASIYGLVRHSQLAEATAYALYIFALFARGGRYDACTVASVLG